MQIKYSPHNVLLGLTSLALAGSLGIGCGTNYKEQPITTCKGETISVGQMEKELRAANYDGPWGNLNYMLGAYNGAACGKQEIRTCKDGAIPLEELIRQLRLARYDGPYDGTSEVEAYNRAACPERR